MRYLENDAYLEILPKGKDVLILTRTTIVLDRTGLYCIYIGQFVSTICIYKAISVFALIISSAYSWTCAKAALRKKENYESRIKKREHHGRRFL